MEMLVMYHLKHQTCKIKHKRRNKIKFKLNNNSTRRGLFNHCPGIKPIGVVGIMWYAGVICQPKDHTPMDCGLT